VADEEPAGIVTEVVAVPPEVAAKAAAPVVVELNDTVVAVVLVVELPELSCSCTVTGPAVAAAEAAPDVAPEVNTSLLAAATVTVKAVLVVPVRPLLAAVSV